MVIPIIIPLPMPRAFGFGSPSVSGSYHQTPIKERIEQRLKDITTSRKTPKQLARKMLKKAIRGLQDSLEYDKKYSINREWHHTGSFNDRWIDHSVSYDFAKRNEAFRLFEPLMRAYVFETYGIEVETKVQIISSEYDSWVAYQWMITPPKAPTPKKRWFNFLRRQH